MMKKLFFLIEEGFPVIAMLVILVISFLQVIFRYCLNNALPWPEELARMLMICCTFVGCGLVAREGKHLEIDCAKHLFGLRVRKVATHFSTLATFVFCGVMFVLAIKMIFFVAESGMTAAAFPVPMWIFWLSLPVGLLLMAIRTATHYRDELADIKKQQAATQKEKTCAVADTLPGSPCDR